MISDPCSRRASGSGVPPRAQHGLPRAARIAVKTSNNQQTFIVYPAHRRLKRRNLIHFRRRLAHNLTLFRQGAISFAELDASVQGWINHVRYADTWGVRTAVFQSSPL